MKLNLSKDATDYPFHCRQTVRISDLAGGMHVGNHVFIAYITEAQLQLMVALGFPKIMVGAAMPINAGLEISYLSEAAYGDELDIAVAVETIESRYYRVIFHITNRDSGRPVCQARMEMNFIDLGKHKRCDVPADFVEAWQRFTG